MCEISYGIGNKIILTSVKLGSRKLFHDLLDLKYYTDRITALYSFPIEKKSSIETITISSM